MFILNALRGIRPSIWVTVTLVECCWLSGWSFISSLIHRPDHVSPLKESQGIDLYTCWLLLTCHSCGMVWHNLAYCWDMCPLTLGTVHLVVLNHCSFRVRARRKGYGGLKGPIRVLILVTTTKELMFHLCPFVNGFVYPAAGLLKNCWMDLHII